MDPNERSILESLDALLQLDKVRSAIAPVVERVERKLVQDPAAAMAWEPLPLSIYGESLPSFIRSSWVFILRAHTATGAERHPNSQQRMMSYRNIGDMQIGGPGRLQSNPLVSDPRAALEQRWISIPINVWHQCVVPAGANWVVVSFHTVPAEELIEERPDADDAGRTHQKTYLASRA
ncbi:MAG TPA: hypothetical protein VG055_16130 [Planctomycetaceae bacterium]|jgi:hypothetical protein|nr:hypothetical protein [Planctomycetaceae bacterium]